MGNFAAGSPAGKESGTRPDSSPVPTVPGSVCAGDSAGSVF